MEYYYDAIHLEWRVGSREKNGCIGFSFAAYISKIQLDRNLISIKFYLSIGDIYLVCCLGLFLRFNLMIGEMFLVTNRNEKTK